MPSIASSHDQPQETRPPPRPQRSWYPMLPAIVSEEMLSATATLESEELAFAVRQGRDSNRYLHALYLKAMAALNHAHFQPKDLPRQFRNRILEQLQLDANLARILTIDRRDKSVIVSAVRAFLGVSAGSAQDREEILLWLRDGIAQKEHDITVLISAISERFREMKVELPSWSAVTGIAECAVQEVQAAVLQAIEHNLNTDDGARLDALLIGRDGRTAFDALKAPSPQATAHNLARELLRLEQLRSFLPVPLVWPPISRHHQQQFAELARHYTAPELAQLNQAWRRALLLCYLTERHGAMLDTAADMLIRVWDTTKYRAREFTKNRQEAMGSTYDAHQQVLAALLAIIKRCRNPDDLWRAIHQYKSLEEYDGILGTLVATPSWQGMYLDKIEDHYSALRRFLPDWYRLVPLTATTADDALARAQEFVREHAVVAQTELPVTGCPTEFLTPPWENRAVKRYARTGRVVRIFKVPYEIGLLDATVHGLKNGTVAIAQARRFAPMVDHLLPREQFLATYEEQVRRLGHPATAREYYAPRQAKLEQELLAFDRDYHQTADTFWVSSNGKLGYSHVPGQSFPPRLKRIKRELANAMPEVSILEVLLDCQRWTGFMDVFRPGSSRQNMSEDEKLRQTLATLYAYGCNCGPIQASRALQVSAQQIVYMRRRYLSTPNLMAAANILANAYQQTAMAERLGEMSVLLTDSMQMRTLKDSVIARQHHRYLSGKSTLLYQHVTANCVCLFTQALLCNVSEAIHLLIGAMGCRYGQESIINICDSAGKSNKVFGLSGLLNILLYPRIRSRHLKLWTSEGSGKYQNIGAAIAGKIRFDLVDSGWQDIMWILASINAGTSAPLTILNQLAAQPHHPAARGLDELGKLDRSLYQVRYGRDLDLRRFVVPYTSRREHWNKFTTEVQAFGDMIREKSLEDQEEVFWFLTVVQNAIILWNALSMENILNKGTLAISVADTCLVLPTMTNHINFVGKFDVDLNRIPLFELIPVRQHPREKHSTE